MRDQGSRRIPASACRRERSGGYHLDYRRPETIGRVKDFVGNAMVVLRVFSWIMSLGAEGLRQVAETAVINNNYLATLLMAIPGVSMSYGYDARPRLDQVRYSLQKLTEDTGLSSQDLQRRIGDYGLQIYWMSHHPETIPQPFTPEPTESYSKEEIDEWAAVMMRLCHEAYHSPEAIRTAPHNGVVDRMDESYVLDESKTCVTWRKWQRMQETQAAALGQS